MVDQTEQMVLVAKLVDEVSDRLRTIQKSMISTEQAFKKGHDAGAKGAKEHGEALRELNSRLKEISESASRAAEPALSALGITSLSVAGAITGVVAAVKQFAEQGVILQRTANRAGLAFDQITKFESLGQRVGVSVEQTNESLSQFGELMDQTARRAPQAMRQWMQMPGAFEQLYSQLQGLSREGQIEKIFEILPRMPYKDQQRSILRLLHLPENWADLTQKQLRETRAYIDEWNRLHGYGPAQQEMAEKVEFAFFKMDLQIKGIKQDLAMAFGDDIVNALTRIDAFLRDPKNVQAMRDAFRQLAEQIKLAVGQAGELGKFIKLLMPPEGYQEAWKKYWESRAGAANVKESMAKAFDPFRTAPAVIPNAVSNLFSPHPLSPLPQGFRPPNVSVPPNQIPQSQLDRNLKDPVKKGVFEGVLDALRSWFVTPAGATELAGGPGSSPSAFGPDSPFKAGIGGFRPTRGRTGGGVTPRGQEPSPLGGGRRGGGPSGDGDGGPDRPATGDGTQSGSLATQREKFRREIESDPQLKDMVINAAQHEGGIQSNLEQIFNYAAMRHMTIRQALQSGQYGPVNRGIVRYGGRISGGIRAQGTAALERVYGGSNITDYATDQGMAGDPNYAKYMSNRSYWGMHKVQGAWFSYHGEPGRQWARRQRQLDEEARANKPKPGDPSAITIRPGGGRPSQLVPSSLENFPARSLYSDRPLAQQRQTFGRLSPAFGGGGSSEAGKPSSASISVDFSNIPRGTKTAATYEGFKDLTINRGFAMPQANEAQ